MTGSSNEMLLRSSLASSLIVAFISGLAGLVLLMQDVVIASHFATGGAADAYQLAISFPMWALNVFAGGTLLAVLVPLLTKLDLTGRIAEATGLLNRARRMLVWLLLVICGIWGLVYPALIGQIAKGFPADTQMLSAQLVWLAVPVLFFAGLAGMDAAILNCRKRFALISALPAFMPAGVILAVLLLEEWLGIFAAALGLLCGSLVQWLAMRQLTAPLLSHSEHYHIPVLLPARFLRDYGTAAASAALLGGIFMTDTYMASTLAFGSTATNGYAVRPVILLLAFVTTVVGNVVLPFFSHLVAISDWQALEKHVLFWFVLLALAAIPVVTLWYFYATDVVALLYQRGAFKASDTTRVAAVQQIYLLQIPFFLVAMIGWRVMNSLNKHTALLSISVTCFVVNLAADIWLAPRMGLQGVAWGSNLAFALLAILIVSYLIGIHVKNAARARHNELSPAKVP